MRSEKLKQLVKDKVPLKFRINCPSQSRELQDFMFALGVMWATDADWALSSINKEEEPYLFCDSERYMDGVLLGGLSSKYAITWDDETEIFEKSGSKEFDLINDRLIEECRWPNLKKLIEDKIPLKFRIKDERHDREFQEFMFTLDVGWLNKGKCFYSTNYPTTISFGAFYPDQPSKVSLFFNGISSEKFFDFANDCLVEEKIQTKTEVLLRRKNMFLKEKLRNTITYLENTLKSEEDL